MVGLQSLIHTLGSTEPLARSLWPTEERSALKLAPGGPALNRISRSISYFRGGRRPAVAPQEIVIELTNRCHLDCPICPRRSARRPVGDIPWEMFVDLVEQAKALGVGVVDLCLAGESLLYPRILEAIREVKKRGMAAYLQTSGAPLDEPLARGLIEARLDIVSFSLDAATPNTYARVRPGAEFARVMANVERFLDLAGSEKRAGRPAPFTIVQMILQDENQDEANEFRRRWMKTGADAIRCKPLGANPAGTETRGPVRAGDGADTDAEGAERPKPPPCTRPWRGMAVTWAGHVLACCYDFAGVYPLGDAAREGLASIWLGEKLASLRRMHAEGRAGELDLCRSCSARRSGPHSKLAAAATLLLDESQVLKVMPRLGRPF